MRKLPPARRLSENVKVVHEDFPYFVTIGYYEDGVSPCEVFVSTAKLGTHLSHTASDFCILISYLLQMQEPLEEVHSWLNLNEKGQPASIAGVIVAMIIERQQQKIDASSVQNVADSVPDTSTYIPTSNDERTLTTRADDHRTTAIMQGYTGDVCSTCQGNHMRRNGSCLVCADCGTTTGCS